MTRFCARLGEGIPLPPIDPPTLPSVETVGGWAEKHPQGAPTGGEGGEVHIFHDNSVYGGQTGFYAMWQFIDDNPIVAKRLVWDGSDVNLLARNYGTGFDPFPSRVPNSGGSIENKTIVTTRGQTWRGGSRQFFNWKNFILRNWKIRGDGLGGEDSQPIAYRPHAGNGMSFNECERGWIDHCDLDSEATIPGTEQLTDGTLDFNLCNFITVSNCRIANSRKTALAGWDNAIVANRGMLKITYRNNLWENNMLRQPFLRFGQFDIVNNVFRYVPQYTNSASQYDWARIIELVFEATVWSRNNKYYGHRYWLADFEWNNPNAISGLVSQGDWFDPTPVFSTFLGSPGTQYPPIGSVRPGNVLWSPASEGLTLPLGLLTPDQAESHVVQWAGAKYHLRYPNNPIQ